MRYFVLATDYDGTIASDGLVDEATLEALVRFERSGRKLVLVTGRELDDLLRVFPDIGLFDRVVAENGAVLYCPETRKIQDLAPPPSLDFVAELRARNVSPLSVGHVIVATWHPNEAVVLDVIRELGLELQVVFNKGAVMVLPSGINKATGLRAALADLGLSAHNAIGVGDAENDHAFLQECECSVAVANALDVLKHEADWVTSRKRGAGVAELIDDVLASDLRGLAPKLTRYHLPLGTADDGSPVSLAPHGAGVLIAGSSGGGKSTLTTALIERLVERGYQFCLLDPEGDYEGLNGATMIGTVQRAPTTDEVLGLLARPDQSVVVNLLGFGLEERPLFCAALLPLLFELRARSARPHWIILDEAHHLLPSGREAIAAMLPKLVESMLLVTVDPERLPEGVMASVDTLITVGNSPGQTIASYCRVRGLAMPRVPLANPERRQAFLCSAGEAGLSIVRFDVTPPVEDLRRHRRKYAEGELGPDKSFYFRGPTQRLNLRAQNLLLFLQIAEGIDDETWLFHLRQGDYSSWFRDAVKDEELASAAAALESDAQLGAIESRALLRSEIERRYTLPA